MSLTPTSAPCVLLQAVTIIYQFYEAFEKEKQQGSLFG